MMDSGWKTPDCPTISSASHCGHLSSDQKKASIGSVLTTFDLDWFF